MSNDLVFPQNPLRMFAFPPGVWSCCSRADVILLPLKLRYTTPQPASSHQFRVEIIICRQVDFHTQNMKKCLLANLPPAVTVRMSRHIIHRNNLCWDRTTAALAKTKLLCSAAVIFRRKMNRPG